MDGGIEGEPISPSMEPTVITPGHGEASGMMMEQLVRCILSLVCLLVR